MTQITRINKEVTLNGKTYQFEMKDDFKRINVISGLPLDNQLKKQVFYKDYLNMSYDVVFEDCNFSEIHYSKHIECIEQTVGNPLQTFYFTQNWEALETFKAVLEQEKHQHLQEHFCYWRLDFSQEQILAQAYPYDAFNNDMALGWEIR